MLNLSLVVLCAGNSTRFGSGAKKQWLRVGDVPLWLYVVEKLSKKVKFNKIIVTATAGEIEYMKRFGSSAEIVAGGDSRQDSIKSALSLVDSDYVMVTDVARACIPKSVIKRLIENMGSADIIVPAVKVSDSVIYEDSQIDRDKIRLIQTPQLSKRDILKKAVSSDKEFNDDSSAVASVGGSIKYIDGSIKSEKITYKKNLKNMKCLKRASRRTLVGGGFDIHPFETGKKMYLGGVNIDSVDYGFKAHSDGDVAIHSIIDAILGAAGAGDIGEMFPDNDNKYRGIDSKILLKEVVNFVERVGLKIVNVDITIMAQKPRVGEYKERIRESLCNILGVKKYLVNIKATTGERLGFVGREEGAAVLSNVTLEYYNWKR